VSWSVDDVNPVGDTLTGLKEALLLLLGPEAGHSGGGDSDATLLLLLHPIRNGVTVIDVTDFVNEAGVEKDPLRRGGLARVDVGANADVPGALQWVLAAGMVQVRIDGCDITHGSDQFGSEG